MKIAINAQFISKPNTGSGQYIINLLSELSKTDKENEYVLYSENDYFKSSDKNLADVKNIKQVCLKTPFYKRDDLIRKIIWEKFVFPRAVKKDRVDLVWSPYFSSSIISGIKHTMTIHDVVYRVFPQYIPNWRWKLYFALAEKAAKKADEVITISQHSKNDIIRFLNIPKEKITVTYLGKPVDKNFEFRILNLELLEDKYKIKNKYILYIGGFDYRKNVTSLVKAYKVFSETDNENISLVIAGKLPSQPNPLAPDLQKLVKDLQLENKVQFVGYVTDNDLPVLYSNAEVFVFPTLYEGFGLPVLEAMSYGCPVISSNDSSIPEIAGNGAILIDPSRPQIIADNIKRILNDENLRQKMIKKGLDNINRFSWEKCASETLALLNSK